MKTTKQKKIYRSMNNSNNVHSGEINNINKWYGRSLWSEQLEKRTSIAKTENRIRKTMEIEIFKKWTCPQKQRKNESIHDIIAIGWRHLWHGYAGPEKRHWRKSGHQTNETKVLFVGWSDGFERSQGEKIQWKLCRKLAIFYGFIFNSVLNFIGSVTK